MMTFYARFVYDVSMFRLFLIILLPIQLFGFYGEAGLGFEHFRSIPEGDWDGNTGSYASVNAATPLCWQELNLQAGGSYGLYDWTGRGSSPTNKQSRLQQQLFLTVGLFKNTACGFNGGIVYDFMWSRGYGVFGTEASLNQLRLQGGYQVCCDNEYGLWGTIRLGTNHQASEAIPLEYRAISQINSYWKHSFCNGAEAMLWIGLPYGESLLFDGGRPGKFIVGGSFHAPLCDRMSIDGHFSYMAPRSPQNTRRERNYASNVCIELKYWFGEECEMHPYMPIGNNSNFIADTNLNF